MTAILGGNAGHPGKDSISPELAASWGAKAYRWPLEVGRDPMPTIFACKEAGIDPWPVHPKEAFFVGDEQVRTPADWQHIIGDHVTTVQVLNEPDGVQTEEGASWLQTKRQVNAWLELARAAYPRPRYRLLGPGLVSGNPGWLSGIRVDLLDSISPHPYAKMPMNARRHVGATPHPRFSVGYRYVPGDGGDGRARAGGVPVGPLLAEYAKYGLPLTVTEYDSRTPGMAAYLHDHPKVSAALVFCLHSYLEFGLVDHPQNLADFEQAAASEFYFVEGFRDIALRYPGLIGLPLENEWGGWKHSSLQRTSGRGPKGGLLYWGLYVESGSRLGYIDLDTGKRYAWNGSSLVER